MPVRTKNLKAPLGFFLFTDKIKKRENGSQYSVLPKFFANQKKHPWFSSKNSVETSWSPLTPEHGFPSLFISARPKALPFCLPVFGLFLSDTVRNFH